MHQLLKTIPDVSGDTKVCAFWTGKKVIDIDSNLSRAKLGSVVSLIGEIELGFSKDEVVLHSIRSGGAMAMLLSGINEIIIQ